MAQKLRNKSAGLRLELNTSFPVDGQQEDSHASHSTNTSSTNWREDIARLVHDEDKLGDLRPDDFENIRKLGEGAAGTVWLVKHKKTGLTMAKKVILLVIYIYKLVLKLSFQ